MTRIENLFVRPSVNQEKFPMITSLGVGLYYHTFIVSQIEVGYEWRRLYHYMGAIIHQGIMEPHWRRRSETTPLCSHRYEKRVEGEYRLQPTIYEPLKSQTAAQFILCKPRCTAKRWASFCLKKWGKVFLKWDHFEINSFWNGITYFEIGWNSRNNSADTRKDTKTTFNSLMFKKFKKSNG